MAEASPPWGARRIEANAPSLSRARRVEATRLNSSEQPSQPGAPSPAGWDTRTCTTHTDTRARTSGHAQHTDTRARTSGHAQHTQTRVRRHQGTLNTHRHACEDIRAHSTHTQTRVQGHQGTLNTHMFTGRHHTPYTYTDSCSRAMCTHTCPHTIQTHMHNCVHGRG